MKMTQAIDVWDAKTFGEELMSTLYAEEQLVRDYIAAEEANDALRESIGSLAGLRVNPHWREYNDGFLANVERRLERCFVRAWHYTRLTESEVDAMRAGGIRISTLKGARERLDARVAAGDMAQEVSDELFNSSPSHDRMQFEGRSNRFWAASHPIPIEDGDVTPLLARWGGEIVHMWLEDPRLERIVANLGRPRVIELSVPLDATRSAYAAAKATVATFVRSLGLSPDFDDFSVCIERPLGPESVLAVHTEGDSVFGRIGRAYPIGFISLES
jgi:hypothetical protein